MLGYIFMSDAFLAGSAAVKRCTGIIHGAGQREVRKKMVSTFFCSRILFGSSGKSNKILPTF